MILSVLEGESLHGYAVMGGVAAAQWWHAGSAHRDAVPRAATSGAGRLPAQRVEHGRRRTYRFTAIGERMLADERSEWRAFAAVVDGVPRSATQTAVLRWRWAACGPN
jgi:PadR family transcriptional regulator, regulatory protein PadR